MHAAGPGLRRRLPLARCGIPSWRYTYPPDLCVACTAHVAGCPECSCAKSVSGTIGPCSDWSATIIESSIAQGMLKPMEEDGLVSLAEKIWPLTLFWLNRLAAGGEEAAESTLRRGNGLVRRTVCRRLTEGGVRMLARSGPAAP
ncbi:hypothetical protein [Geobacter anodireducens]